MKAIATTALLAAACCGGAAGADPVPDSVYDPLTLYAGVWSVLTDGSKDAVRLENKCSRTGLFYSCEQVVDGKPVALVVFLPVTGRSGAVLKYRTQALTPEASPGGEWSRLSIDGDRWTYLWESVDAGRKVYWRNVNVFSGKDKVHFEVSNSANGSTWKLQSRGDEVRIK